MNKKRKRKDIIIPTCSDVVLPITLVLGAYIILHGHLSPGGGFQGGVLLAGAIAIFFIAYGREKVMKTFHLHRLKISEDLGALGFVFIATLGIIYGSAFCGNVIAKGTAGDLFSSGTIFLMNFAVGYKVLAGIGVLILVMIGTLRASEDEEEGGQEDDN